MDNFLIDTIFELRLSLLEKQDLLGPVDVSSQLVKLTCSLVGMQQSRSKKADSVPRLTRVVLVAYLQDGTFREVTVEYLPKRLPRYEDGSNLYERIKDGSVHVLWERAAVELEVLKESWPELPDELPPAPPLDSAQRLSKVIEIIETAHGPQDFVEDAIGRVAVRLQDLKFDPENTPVNCRFKLVFFHRDVSITPYASFELVAGYSPDIDWDWRTEFGVLLFDEQQIGWHDLFVREGCASAADIKAEDIAPLLEQTLQLDASHQQTNSEPLPAPQGKQRDEDLAIVDTILRQYAPLPVVFELPNDLLINLIPRGALLFSSRQTVLVEHIRIETGVDRKRGPFVQVECLLDWDLSELTVVLHGVKRDLFEQELKGLGLILPRQDVSLILKPAVTR